MQVVFSGLDYLACFLRLSRHNFFDLNAEHPKEVWLHHPLVGVLPRGTAPANGQPVPQLPGGDDVTLPVSHCAAGRRDGEAALPAARVCMRASRMSSHNVCMLALSWQ